MDFYAFRDLSSSRYVSLDHKYEFTGTITRRILTKLIRTLVVTKLFYELAYIRPLLIFIFDRKSATTMLVITMVLAVRSARSPGRAAPTLRHPGSIVMVNSRIKSATQNAALRNAYLMALIVSTNPYARKCN